MDLYLVRHADALAKGDQGVTRDEERPLSERGLGQAKLLAASLRRLGIVPDYVLSSPLRRAVQTADEIVQVLQITGLKVAVCEQLAPGKSPKKLAKELLKVDPKHLLLIGQEPDLSGLAAWLIGCRDARLEFAKAGAACVSCDGVVQKGAGTLSWLVTPRLLQKLS
jgi:phosphohistidine phosphatase